MQPEDPAFKIEVDRTNPKKIQKVRSNDMLKYWHFSTRKNMNQIERKYCEKIHPKIGTTESDKRRPLSYLFLSSNGVAMILFTWNSKFLYR